MTIVKNIFQGDPRLILGVNGSRLQFTGGQPLMDQGLENLAMISLFTSPGWPGNDLLSDPNQKIGSDFESSTHQPITLQALYDIRDAAVKALSNPAFGIVTAEVTNPNGHRIDVRILIQPPGQDIRTLLLTKNGLNWQAQAFIPANQEVI